MTQIRISTDVSTESLRQILQSFKMFSTVEVSVDHVEPKIMVLHEVNLGERIRRFFFQSLEERKWHSQQSKFALQILAWRRPEINALLGKSILQKEEWTSVEFREALRIPASILKPAKSGGELQVKLDQPGQVGVAKAKASEIAADCKVSWKLSPRAHEGAAAKVDPNHSRTHAEISVMRTDDPGKDELRSAYRIALARASGHVVIAPIDDVPHDKRAEMAKQKDGKEVAVDVRYCSDTSLTLLLDAIDAAKDSNRKITAVTIAGGEYPADKSLSVRLVQQQSRLRAATAQSPVKFSLADSQRGLFEPKGNERASGLSGMHFVKNSALSLHANRTIVPLSTVLTKKLDAVSENEARYLPRYDDRRLIAFNDSPLDSPSDSSAHHVEERTALLLAGFVGKVVISPPNCDDDQLLAMLTAVRKACKENSMLSVTFAVDEEAQRDRLTKAYANMRAGIADQRERDNDVDEEEESINADELWKSV